MADTYIKDVEMATLFELRLLFKNGSKEQYTTEEIFDIIDKLAEAELQKK